MSPQKLHAHLNASLRAVFGSGAEADGLRALIEGGGVENFLTGLLFIRLHVSGHKVTREFPVGNRCAADIAVHGTTDIYIEAKQLNLKDGCKYAPQNLVNDMSRHRTTSSLGVLYIVDERHSRTAPVFHRFGGANRRAKYDIASVLAELPRFFCTVFPSSVDQGLLREFVGIGNVRLYGFVVAGVLKDKRGTPCTVAIKPDD